jgi:lipopolysaccharide/colanic/teichoic acid biosynthesis glycosyltransferase
MRRGVPHRSGEDAIQFSFPDMTTGRVMTRAIEIALALAGLIVCIPVFLVVAILIVLHDGGPVLYRARRVGLRGDPFALLKFRSMVLDADQVGGGLTTAVDSRVTPVGAFLRKYKLDELPQLWNVLRGDMSFVGPRPEDPRYVSLYSQEQRRVLNVRPGITSPASLEYRNESALLSGEGSEAYYVGTILPHKLALELEYLERRTLWTDIGLILRTVSNLTR